MRVSNADRERFAKVLHDAMAEGRLTLGELEERLDRVYAAKTFGDLEPVVRDLPGHQITLQAAAPSAPGRVGGRGTSSSAIAMLSGADRTGVWTIPPTFNAVAFMGGVKINLMDARFEARETVINAYALMGGIDIIVPPDVTVYVTGSGIMGGFSNRSTEGTPGGPVLRITGFAFWGGVDVRTPKRSKGRRKHLGH
ncbi:Cell wall-active antibiotics response 4TMS YvqF [Actinokineospora iranica]|uniref:Cell wall-active antibiotics response 4TMS YvqF n=2 Tax=Actinokineospora iranica TaxID=1271860 RepID=A0A1G6SRV9_9PSEU|nr:Cell wall-active antibiotics response 4TMS YvqF [Actinokineospora iranica]